jgi:hypothetical protein
MYYRRLLLPDDTDMRPASSPGGLQKRRFPVRRALSQAPKSCPIRNGRLKTIKEIFAARSRT